MLSIHKRAETIVLDYVAQLAYIQAKKYDVPIQENHVLIENLTRDLLEKLDGYCIDIDKFPGR